MQVFFTCILFILACIHSAFKKNTLSILYFDRRDIFSIMDAVLFHDGLLCSASHSSFKHVTAGVCLCVGWFVCVYALLVCVPGLSRLAVQNMEYFCCVVALNTLLLVKWITICKKKQIF